MIKVNKPKQAPSILLSSGKAKTQDYCQAYDENPAIYQKNQVVFSFNASIYGHPAVKDALVAAQHSKCCFCESKVGHDGDVEHFRPKAAYRQAASKKLLRPGYYWLAYDWGNLFLACSACNSRQKGNLFPLLEPKSRARCHKDNLELETPMFINPAEEDPEEFISFRLHIPFAIKGNKRGKQTIKALGLDRDIMNEKRRAALRQLVDQIKILNLYISLNERGKIDDSDQAEWKDIVAEAQLYIDECIQDAAEYSGMTRAFFKVPY